MNPAPDVSVLTRGDPALYPGDHDDLGSQFDVAQIGTREELVEGAGSAEGRAVAANAVVFGQQSGAEGDLDARALREPGKGVGEEQAAHREAGGCGEEGASFGVDADLASEQRDLLRLLGGQGSREEAGQE